MEQHVAVASGYLHKAAGAGSLLARWHRRYYVLYSDGLLSSFKTERANYPGRVIPVGRLCLRMKFGRETSSEDCSSWPRRVSRELCFSIINTDRSYHFYCEEERAFISWRSKLVQVLNKLSSQASFGVCVGEPARTYHSAPAMAALEEEEEDGSDRDGVPADKTVELYGSAYSSSGDVEDTSLKCSVEVSKEDNLPYYSVLETFTVGLVDADTAAEEATGADREFNEYMSSCDGNADGDGITQLEHSNDISGAAECIEISFSEMTQPVEAAALITHPH